MNERYIRVGIGLIIVGLLIWVYFQFGHVIFDQTHKIDQEAEHSMSGVNTIKIKNINADITIYTADYDDFYATFQGVVKSPTKKDVPLLKASQEGDVLSIEIDHMAINISSMEDMSFDIFLPTEYHSNLEILTESGNVVLPAMRLDHLACVTNSGHIKTKSLDTNTMLLSTISGDIEATIIQTGADSSVLNKVTIDTVTGTTTSDYEHELNSSHQFLTTSGDILIIKK